VKSSSTAVAGACVDWCCWRTDCRSAPTHTIQSIIQNQLIRLVVGQILSGPNSPLINSSSGGTMPGNGLLTPQAAADGSSSSSPGAVQAVASSISGYSSSGGGASRKKLLGQRGAYLTMGHLDTDAAVLAYIARLESHRKTCEVRRVRVPVYPCVCRLWRQGVCSLGKMHPLNLPAAPFTKSPAHRALRRGQRRRPARAGPHDRPGGAPAVAADRDAGERAVAPAGGLRQGGRRWTLLAHAM
jgi:hypothetical protein